MSAMGIMCAMGWLLAGMLLVLQERKIRALRREVEERAYHIGRQAEVDRQTAVECATKEAKAAEDRIMELLEDRLIQTDDIETEMLRVFGWPLKPGPKVVNGIRMGETLTRLLTHLGLEEVTHEKRTVLRKKAKAGGKG